MAFKDLREFIDKLEEVGEVKTIRNADWDLEIGAISEIMAERDGPALIFDEIKGYPIGFMVADNLYTTMKRKTLALGLPEGLNEIEYIQKWRDIFKEFKPINPVEIDTGPVMENVHQGNQVDLYEFPTPRWHEQDGGRYIGTGCMVITRDPDEGWVNFGTYRGMLHDKDTIGFYVSPMQHGNLMRRKYWSKGLSCPVAIALGQEPALFAASTCFLPWGVSEYDFAGYLRNEPVEVVKGEVTGLPIPAYAEIVIEGEAPPPEVETRAEGPFGEWTGYYAHGSMPEPIIKVKSVMHRNNPILHGAPPYKPPTSYTFDLFTWRAAVIWNQLEMAGVPGIQGVYLMPAAGGNPISVISIKQSYGGHARQAGLVAAGCKGGAYLGRFVIIVDDDIDPSNSDDVLWALATRCDPATSIDLLTGCLSSALDPRIEPDKKRKGDFTNSKAIINACKPYHWMGEYPLVNKISSKLRQQTTDKWSHLFS